MRMRHIVVCGLSGSTIFFLRVLYLIHGTVFVKKVIEYKMRVLIVSTTFV
jgi:hypothetical protein